MTESQTPTQSEFSSPRDIQCLKCQRRKVGLPLRTQVRETSPTIDRQFIKHRKRLHILNRDPVLQSKHTASRCFPMIIQLQKDIQRLDGGASAYIYAVTNEIVLKAPVIYCPLPEGASSQDRYSFSLDTFYYHEDIQNERDILRTLETAPHPNIIQPIALDYAEGLYLRRHQSLPSILAKGAPSGVIRKCFYRDMLRALAHLHELKIAHADVRIDNFLYEEGGLVLLCDFTCSRSFGGENPSSTSPPEPVGVNGPYSQVSDITDRFALGSVIFEIETGNRPALHFDGVDLNLPSVRTGDAQLDDIVQKAWHNDFASTAEMLQAVENLLPDENLSPKYGLIGSSVLQSLRIQISEWRALRQYKYGTRFSICIALLLTVFARRNSYWDLHRRSPAKSSKATK